MGFISYSLDFYNGELQNLESCVATNDSVYRAKQLLKMLDDLMDEGYTELNEKLEETCQGVSRLRKYLKDHNAEPFKLSRNVINKSDVTYEQEDLELGEVINAVIEKTRSTKAISDDAFLKELICFCKWIGYEEDTAYIFLLRDTLLPYIYYLNKHRTSIYPWLLGRETLTKLVGKKFVDDEIRVSIIKALECGHCCNFDEFCNFVLPDIRETLNEYPEIENCLSELLNGIGEKNIIVIESGCSGTFPMLLMSLDSRVDIRMYTTYPYLKDIYGNRIYTPKYEENRLFETLYSQDVYFRFSRLKSSHFYVNKCSSREVEEKSLAEIRTILEQRSK